LRSLDSKIAEIIGRQERMFTLLSSSNQQPTASGSGLPPAQQQQVIDTFRRDEVNHIMNQQNDLVKIVRDIYASVSDTQRKTSFLSEQASQRANQQQQPSGAGTGGGGADVAVLQQINESIKTLKHEMASQTARVSVIVYFCFKLSLKIITLMAKF
jgi:4-diphosphocytidyl-2C-methyl-D-erythritol kinase